VRPVKEPTERAKGIERVNPVSKPVCNVDCLPAVIPSLYPACHSIQFFSR
jgi:hypothetical protein